MKLKFSLLAFSSLAALLPLKAADPQNIDLWNGDITAPVEHLYEGINLIQYSLQENVDITGIDQDAFTLGRRGNTSPGLMFTGTDQKYDLSFQNNAGHIILFNDASNSSRGYFAFAQMGNLSFKGNGFDIATDSDRYVKSGNVLLSFTSYTRYPSGLSLYFFGIDSLSVTENKAAFAYAEDSIQFRGTGGLTFTNNQNHISKEKQSGLKYIAESASMFARRSFSMENTGKVEFRDNESNLGYGVIVSRDIAFIGNKGGVLFENNKSGVLPEGDSGHYNYSKDMGGALVFTGEKVENYSPSLGSGILLATQGDIIFRNNRENYANHGGNLNAILLGGIAYSAPEYSSTIKALNLYAEDGREIVFYDPIRPEDIYIQYGRSAIDPYYVWQDISYNFNQQASEQVSAETEDWRILNYYLTLNPPEQGKPFPSFKFGGTIRFSGEVADEVIVQDIAGGETEESWQDRLYASKYVNICGTITLHAGRLVVEHGIVFGDTEIDKHKGDFLAKSESTLEITTGSNFHIRNFKAEENVVFRNGDDVRLFSQSVDLSQGLIFDFQPWLHTHRSGITIDADSLNLGGGIVVCDTNNGQKLLDFYANPIWAKEQQYMILAPANAETAAGTTGDFSGIISDAFKQDVVDNPYEYRGIWKVQWKDTDGDGLAECYAVWMPTAGPEQPEPGPGPDPKPDPTPEPQPELHPELVGDGTMNSLWSTTSNMAALSDSALGRIGPDRYKLEKCANYWATGLGDFDMHRSVSGRDGYDYNGFGYAVGADTRICPNNWLLGAAFGNLYGKNKSRNFASEIKQTSYIGQIYGGYLKEMDARNLLNFTGSLSYGITSNKQTSYYSDGLRSRGKWDNTAWRATLKAEWFHALDNNWTLSPFLGLEYDDARSDSFTEAGDRARTFGKGSLKNLALPIGVALSKELSYNNGMKWLHRLAASYVPDVYRKNPEATAFRPDYGLSWQAHGVQPDRNAARLEYDTTWIINSTWSLFAGYSVEGRKNAVYQNANIGASITF